MAKKISNHKYSLSFGYPLDREEATVTVNVDTDPTRKIKEIQWSDGKPMKISNSEHIATLEMEEGRDKIQIVLYRSTEVHPIFERPPGEEIYLYLDEFMDALERAKKLLLNEK